MQKLIRRILTLSLLLLATATHVYALDSQYTVDGITYGVMKSGSTYWYVKDGDSRYPAVTVLSVSDAAIKDGKAVIPEKVELKNSAGAIEATAIVKALGGGGDSSPLLKEVDIPNTVCILQTNVFKGSSIEELALPTGVLTDNAEVKWESQQYPYASGFVWALRQAFAGMLNLKKFTVKGGGTQGDDFSVDENGALYNKDKTTLYCVPPMMQDGIDENGVYQVAEGVKTINTGAFMKNNFLKRIKIPASVTDIKNAEWHSICTECRNIEYFEIDENNKTYYNDDSGVIIKGQKDVDGAELVYYPQGSPLESYKVPDNVTKVGGYCFDQVGNYGIRKWSEKKPTLEKLDLNNVKELDKNRSIFAISELKELTIPAELTDIPDGAIEGCSKLEKYIVEEDNPEWWSDEKGVVYSKDKKKLLLYPIGRAGNYDILDGTETIAGKAFASSNIENVTIPTSVTTIEESAFHYNNSLKTVEFAEPASIETLAKDAFTNCKKIEEITLPSSLVTLGTSVFNACEGLKKVHVADGSNLDVIEGNAFNGCNALETFDFLGSCTLKTIEENAFSDKKSLKEFHFPASVETIEPRAFDGCSALTVAEFAEDAKIKTIGSNAFANCNLKEMTIPASVETIGPEAFKSCEALTKVDLTTFAKDIDPEAFKYCNNLVEIATDKENTKYSSSDGILLTKDKKELVLFPPGKANKNFTLLPPSITKVGHHAFYYCQELTNVTIPNKVTEIGDRAFGYCENLKTVTFLCDEMIDPTKIPQGDNASAFDTGVANTGNGSKNQYSEITINVRKDLLEKYQNNEFYNQFKGIVPSFYDTDGEGNADGPNEFIAVSDTYVDLLSTKSTDFTYLVPKKAKDGERTYTVGLVGDYFLQTTGSDMKEVVLFNNVEYIGAKAFMTDIGSNRSTVENIIFVDVDPTTAELSTVKFDLDDTGSDYREFAESQKIYVQKTKQDTYKNTWPKFAGQVGYKIPYKTKGAFYGTLSREFAIDLKDSDDDYQASNTREGWNYFEAFTAGEKREGTGDSGTETEYHLFMKSINYGSGSASYIPANTGVLICVADKDAETRDLYYRVAEVQKDGYDGENLLRPVVINGMTIDPKAAGYDTSNPYYVLGADNLLHAIKNNSYTLDPHEAYLQLPQAAAGKLLVLDFEYEADGIREATTLSNASATGACYDLQGRRVDNPQRGLYIRDGRKVVVK